MDEAGCSGQVTGERTEQKTPVFGGSVVSTVVSTVLWTVGWSVGWTCGQLIVINGQVLV